MSTGGKTTLPADCSRLSQALSDPEMAASGQERPSLCGSSDTPAPLCACDTRIALDRKQRAFSPQSGQRNGTR